MVKLIGLFEKPFGNCGMQEFLNRFGASKEDAEGCEPLFLAISQSHGGEMANSLGIFVKDESLHMVSGSECSAWDFDGQFELEPISMVELIKMARGGYGGNSCSDSFNAELIACVSAIMNLPSEILKKSEVLSKDLAEYISSEEFNLQEFEMDERSLLNALEFMRINGLAAVSKVRNGGSAITVVRSLSPSTMGAAFFMTESKERAWRDFSISENCGYAVKEYVKEFQAAIELAGDFGSEKKERKKL